MEISTSVKLGIARKTYSGENFEPTTRFYAFYDNTMIGYISSAKGSEVEGVIYGNTRTPCVVNGHHLICTYTSLNAEINQYQTFW